MNNNYLAMFLMMFISGFLSTMNMWVDKFSDIRFSVNDLYMIFLMNGWMFLFMGIFYKEIKITLLGLLLIISNNCACAAF